MALTAIAPHASARVTKEEQKELKKADKQNRAALKSSVDKAAKKEAKKYLKEGWKVMPGALPLEKQLDRSYVMQMDINSDGEPTYIMGEGMSNGRSYDVAKNAAIVVAKQNIMQQIETAMTGSTELQLASGDGQQIENVITVAKGILSQELSRVTPVTEIYRQNKNGSYDVLVRVAYSSEKIRSTFERAAKEKLGDRADKLLEQIDKMFEE